MQIISNEYEFVIIILRITEQPIYLTFYQSLFSVIINIEKIDKVLHGTQSRVGYIQKRSELFKGIHQMITALFFNIAVFLKLCYIYKQRNNHCLGNLQY